MKDFTIYLSGGMSKYGKENFDIGDAWRRYCKKTTWNKGSLFGEKQIKR